MLEFIESPIFERLVYDYLSEDDYAAFQQSLAQNPEAGDLVTGSGGCRKIRWGRSGIGKRGGVRIIYYAWTRAGQILLLTIYGKNTTATIAAHVLRTLKDEMTRP